MARRRPAPHFDLDYLTSLDNPSASREVYLLSEPAQRVLDALAEIVLWRTRWFNEDGTPVLDGPPDLAYQIYEELKVPLHFDELLPYFDGIEPKLDQIINKPCCGANGVGPGVGTDAYGLPDDVTVGTGDPPVEFQSNPLADYDDSGTVTWDDYSVYLCDAGHRLAQAMDNWLTLLRFGTTFDAFSLSRTLVSDLISRMFPGRVDDVILLAWDQLFDWVASLGSWLVGAPSAGDWDGIMTAWTGGIRNQLICHVAQAINADTAAADVRADMQSLYAGATWNALWTLFPFKNTLRKVFRGAEAYEGPLACDCLPLLPTFPDFVLSRVEDATFALVTPESGESLTQSYADGVYTIGLQAGGWPAFRANGTWANQGASIRGYRVNVLEVTHGSGLGYNKAVVAGVQQSVAIDRNPGQTGSAILMGSAAGPYSGWSTAFKAYYDECLQKLASYDAVYQNQLLEMWHYRIGGTYTTGLLTVKFELLAIHAM